MTAVGALVLAQNNLLESCRLGRAEEVREALQAGVDPNSTDGPMQRSCLMVAILNDHKEVVDLLLSWPSIKVNAKDRQNSSALHLACYSGNVACLNKLLTIPGIRLNEKDHQGRTPIMRAIKYGKIEAVRVMTAVDEVDLEVKDNQGRDLEEFASWVACSYPTPVQSIEMVLRHRPSLHTLYEIEMEMVAILNELRRKRRTRWVRKQQNRVLLIGLYKDQDSPLKMLRTPNNVVNDVMSIVWDYLTWRWQVYDETPTTENVQEQKFKEKNCLIL